MNITTVKMDPEELRDYLLYVLSIRDDEIETTGDVKYKLQRAYDILADSAMEATKEEAFGWLIKSSSSLESGSDVGSDMVNTLNNNFLDNVEDAIAFLKEDEYFQDELDMSFGVDEEDEEDEEEVDEAFSSFMKGAPEEQDNRTAWVEFGKQMPPASEWFNGKSYDKLIDDLEEMDDLEDYDEESRDESDADYADAMYEDLMNKIGQDFDKKANQDYRPIDYGNHNTESYIPGEYGWIRE